MFLSFTVCLLYKNYTNLRGKTGEGEKSPSLFLGVNNFVDSVWGGGKMD